MSQVEVPSLVEQTLAQARATVQSVGLTLKVIAMKPGQGPDIALQGVQASGDHEVGVKVAGGTTNPFLAQMVTISTQSKQPGEMVDQGGEIGVIIYNPYEKGDKRTDERSDETDQG